MKRFFRENRVFVILMGIVLICTIVIISILLIYFYKGSGDNSSGYGNRLKDVKNHIIEDKQLTEYNNKLSEDKKVSNVKINIQGKIVYISITFTSETDLVEAQSKATSSLDNFGGDEKSFYDFHFFLKSDAEDGFVISGAKNKGSAIVIWNNNVPID